MTLPSIEHLVAGAVRREARAERLLYEHHAKPVHRFVLGWVRDGEDASEVVQETFARAFRLLPTLGEPGQFRPWLYGIARNVCLECLKTRRTQPCPETLLLLRGSEDESPEHAFLGRETAHLVEGALSRLPETRARALRLRVEHLSYLEIAERLGCSVAKAKVEVHRARRALARALEAAYEASRRSARVASGVIAACVAVSLAVVLCGSSPPEIPAPMISTSASIDQARADEPLASLLPDASVYTACVMPPEPCSSVAEQPSVEPSASFAPEPSHDPLISERPVTCSLLTP